ncbi:hypothetical protein ACHAQA_004410 [Verticillium albo-atrum]
MSISIARATFEHHREALGIDEARPRISWRFEGNVSSWEQSSYELEVARQHSTDPLLYSQNSSTSVLVPWPGDSLGAREQARVRVRSHGGDKQPSTPWSDWVSVETGLLNQQDWGGAYAIVADHEQDPELAKRPTYFRKNFFLDDEASISSARLYVTALGIFEAEINGQPVGDHKLAPGFQAYTDRHVYNTFDVTGHMQEGGNAIGVTVAEGWYAGRFFDFDKFQRNIWGDRIGLLALLTVTFGNGTTVEIPSDDSWRAGFGPLTAAEIYDGEHYDSRLEADIDGWSEGGFDDSAWVGVVGVSIRGKLSAPDGPPVRAMEEVRAKEIFRSPSGKLLVDFGQNIVGWLRLTVDGPAGTNITLRHAEVLEDGELAIRPLRTAKALDTLILHGEGQQTWEPRFTYHGFRYAQVDGWPEAQTPFTIDSLLGIVIHSDMEQTGWLKTSNELLNKLHSNVRWSMKGNFVSIPTDCPQRDERAGWTGDATAFGPTSNFLYDTSGFWRSWHRDVYADMMRHNTSIPPFFVPTSLLSFPGSAAAIWGDVVVFNPWQLWQAFGDAAMLAEQYTQATAWIDQGVPRTKERLWQEVLIQFGDWLDPQTPPENPLQSLTSSTLVADAYLIRSTEILADMSKAIGNCAASTKYRHDHEAIRQAFLSKWSDGHGVLANHTQTAYALGIVFDIFEDQHIATAVEKLRDIIAANDYRIGTGFAGTSQIGFALHKSNSTDDFYKMLLQEELPSWLYQVVMGGTTTWERWDSLLPNGTVNPGEMTSFNHYAFGSVANWMHEVIGGLAPEQPGWRVVRVAPVPGGGITSAQAKYLSAYGVVSTSWFIDSDGFTLEVHIPPNTQAVVSMPNGGEVKRIGSGYHRFADAGYHTR